MRFSAAAAALALLSSWACSFVTLAGGREEAAAAEETSVEETEEEEEKEEEGREAEGGAPEGAAVAWPWRRYTRSPGHTPREDSSVS